MGAGIEQARGGEQGRDLNLRQSVSFEEPERDQRGIEKAAAETVQTEQQHEPRRDRACVTIDLSQSRPTVARQLDSI